MQLNQRGDMDAFVTKVPRAAAVPTVHTRLAHGWTTALSGSAELSLIVTLVTSLLKHLPTPIMLLLAELAHPPTPKLFSNFLACETVPIEKNIEDNIEDIEARILSSITIYSLYRTSHY